MTNVKKFGQSIEQDSVGNTKLSQNLEELHHAFPVDEIERLNKINPTLAEKAFSVWEKSINFIMEVANKEISIAVKFSSKAVNTERFRIVCAFLLTLGGGWCSYQLIMNNHDTAGSVFAGSTLIALIKLFLSQQVETPKQDAEKK